MKKIHECIERLHNPDLAVLLIRIALGVVFINAGWMKINNIDMVVGGFASIGIPMSLAYFVTYAEFIGGILLVLGVAVRYASIVLAIIMLVATKILFIKGFSLQGGGYEYVLTLFLAAASLVTTGSGAYSLARVWKK